MGSIPFHNENSHPYYSNISFMQSMCSHTFGDDVNGGCLYSAEKSSFNMDDNGVTEINISYS